MFIDYLTDPFLTFDLSSNPFLSSYGFEEKTIISAFHFRGLGFPYLGQSVLSVSEV